MSEGRIIAQYQGKPGAKAPPPAKPSHGNSKAINVGPIKKQTGR